MFLYFYFANILSVLRNYRGNKTELVMNLLKRTNTKEYSIAERERKKNALHCEKRSVNNRACITCPHFLVYFIFAAIKYDILPFCRLLHTLWNLVMF